MSVPHAHSRSRVMSFFVLLILVSVTQTPLSAQQTPSSNATAVVTKDPQAIAVIQSALSTLSSSTALAYQDSVATGTLTVSVGAKPLAMPIIIKTKGTRMTRVDLQKPKGTTVRIVNNGTGVILQPDGSVKRLLTNNTLVERVNNIPAFSLLADFQDPTVSVESYGVAQISSRPVNVVALRPLVVVGITQAQWDSTTTRTTFYLDQTTGVVSKIAYTEFGENDPKVGELIEVLLSNYQAVDGTMVPLRQTTYVAGRLESDLMLSSVIFNTGVLDSEFALPK